MEVVIAVIVVLLALALYLYGPGLRRPKLTRVKVVIIPKGSANPGVIQFMPPGAGDRGDMFEPDSVITLHGKANEGWQFDQFQGTGNRDSNPQELRVPEEDLDIDLYFVSNKERG